MTQELFREDAYRRESSATIVAIEEGGVRLDRTVFYPRGGGQAGDAGTVVAADGTALEIADTVKQYAPSPLGEGRGEGQSGRCGSKRPAQEVPPPRLDLGDLLRVEKIFRCAPQAALGAHPPQSMKRINISQP